MPDLSDEPTALDVDNVPRERATQLGGAQSVGRTARINLRIDVRHTSAVTSDECPHGDSRQSSFLGAAEHPACTRPVRAHETTE
jgi:hypothetical protein